MSPSWAVPSPRGQGPGQGEAGEPRQVWGHAEQRLGFGGGPSAPDPWGWEQWLGRCCLARCLGTSLFFFPAPTSPSSPRSLPPQQAHPVRWPLDSTFLHADLFAVAASTCSHREVGNAARDWGDVEGGLRWASPGPRPCIQGPEGIWGERGVAPQARGSPVPPALRSWTAFSPV